jgi:putative acetyltransferase
MLLPDTIEIREQRLSCDPDEILVLNRLAFGPAGGTAQFDQLRRQPGKHLSLVASNGPGIVGHAFFAPVNIDSEGKSRSAMGLGELAVHPDWQRRGIGKALTQRGISSLAAQGYPCVIVIGLPDYYPLLGFEPGAAHGLRCQWPGVPANSFMVYVLDAPAMQGIAGTARYLDL